MIGSLLTFLVVGFVSLVVLGIALSVVGAIIGTGLSIAGFLLFKVAPLLLVGWVVLKVLDRGKKKGELSAADQRWLEGK